MAKQISEEIHTAVKDLISEVSGFEEGSDVFNHIQRHILTKLKKSNTMYFLNKKEVDENIKSMAEKFVFHGFSPQAKALTSSYNSYVTENLPKPELMNRLNIVKFILCMSERPTSNFLENPEEFATEPVKEEEEINWAEYLNEGIERWSPNFDESSDNSEGSCLDDDTNTALDSANTNTSHIPIVIDGTVKDTVVDLRSNREELLATIQHTWYNQDRFHMKPFSDWREANIGILWEEYLEEQVQGLVPIEKASVLSEYKVIREILWQLWTPHTSAMFELDGDKLKPRTNVTVSSIRSGSFENFVCEFIPYIEVLDFFREFSKSLEIPTSDNVFSIPQTFQSYNNSLHNIIRPIYKKLSELEDTVREQETTYTLLNLANDLESICKPLFVLKKIHCEVVVDFNTNSPLQCATTLLARLQDSLQYSVNKLEQDLKVTLFLESLYYYFTLIDAWLMKNDLSDYSQEFLIINKNKNLFTSSYDECDLSVSESENWKLNFDLREGITDFCSKNGIMKIITDTVLQIGRNIHLLRLLGKYSLLNDSNETIHEEFIRKTIEGLCKFFDICPDEFIEKRVVDGENFENASERIYKYPVVCTDQCKKPTEMDKLENLVDVTDGFLMKAFEGYLFEQSENEEQPGEHKFTLFEKISKITTTMFPTANFFEKNLTTILKDRFTISGLMVKNILIERYLLEKQFAFLRHTFLFFDDMIFPFYRRLFEKTSSFSKNWGNDIWLTSHFQDVLMDVYPEFYENCLVLVKDNWRHCIDSLDACNMISLQYEIDWPLNIIISSSQMALYKNIFRFILKIKWALYTVNHLAFTDLEPKKQQKNQIKSHRVTIMKMKYLKFCLINILNSIQHYIFSFVFTKCLQKFELDFEKANDLSSIMVSHSHFISTVHSMILDIRNCGRDRATFKNIINCVKMLKLMWDNLEYATPDRLNDYHNVYRQCYKTIDPIVCPVYIFDY